jgi:osmotically-inducible protein OsmY
VFHIKTDTQLHTEVLDELKWQPTINGAEIAVAVKEGVVTLTGKVDSYAQKYAAERAAMRVSGVRAIAEDLRVRIPGDKRRDDAEIAHAALATLKWDVEVPDDTVLVKVENGYVTLEGNCDWHYQRAAAERAVRNLTGVRGVINFIKIAPQVSAFEVKSKIEQALKRSAELDARGITVEAANAKVTLKGHVRSWRERQDAELAAWSAPGVKEVEDKLLVAM